MPRNLLPANTAPHRAKHVDAIVRNIVATVLTSKRSTTKVDKLLPGALAHMQERLTAYVDGGKDAEAAYESAFADVSSWTEAHAG